MFHDARYGVEGRAGDWGGMGDGNWYHFPYQNSRRVRVDYRRGGALTPDPTSGVATIRLEYLDGAEKRVFLDAAGTPVANRNGLSAVTLRYDSKGTPVE